MLGLLFVPTLSHGGQARLRALHVHRDVRVRRLQLLRGGGVQAWNVDDPSKDLEAPLPDSGIRPEDTQVKLEDVRNDDSKAVVYLKCLFIALLWVGIGTVFYSYHNNWPMPQSFFYAVDAGMSIGFCTDVAEKTISSRAFTVIFILLGASCVGGALALFVEDTMEGVLATSTRGYRRLLEQQAFVRADANADGSLTYDEFRSLVRWSGHTPSEPAFALLCRRFDRAMDGCISYREFKRSYPALDGIVEQCERNVRSGRSGRGLFGGLLGGLFGGLFGAEARPSTTGLHARLSSLHGALLHEWHVACQLARRKRIYIVFGLWMAMGISWGVFKQKWDVITSTHFAVSALATGGLTAPQVNADGILPADDSIFVGVYCLV